MSEKRSCGFCDEHFLLHENHTGLVLNDNHFLCANCCSNNPNEKIINWAKLNSDETISLRPIHVWMIEKSIN